jgi:hypothetical protein
MTIGLLTGKDEIYLIPYGVDIQQSAQRRWR